MSFRDSFGVAIVMLTLLMLVWLFLLYHIQALPHPQGTR